MKYLIKEVLKPIYFYLTNRRLRLFNNLLSNDKRYKRNTEVCNIGLLDFTVDVPDYKSFIWQYKSIFCDEIYEFSSLSDSPVILDCGSNIGMSLIYFSKKYPKARILGFEPDPILIRYIKRNLTRNLISNVSVIEAAVWINDKGVGFTTDGADGGHISSIGNNEKEIRSVRLHDVINNEEIVDFLKIDIEGAEIEVLKDCSNVLHKVKNIFVEFHSFYNGPQELNVLLDILSKNGFRYYVQNEQIRQHPFVNKRTTSIMDMQLNIFAYRND